MIGDEEWYEVRKTGTENEFIEKQLLIRVQTEIHNLIGRLNAVTDAFNEMCNNLDSADLNWKPAPAAWSIAQILQHLIQLNTTYFPAFTSLQAGTYRVSWVAKIPFVPRMFGRMILNSVKPQNVRKVKTFPIWDPTHSSINPDTLETFINHQSAFRNWLETLSPLTSKRTYISSPANANIVYSLNDAFQIIVTHEERHLGQARRVLMLIPQKY